MGTLNPTHSVTHHSLTHSLTPPFTVICALMADDYGPQHQPFVLLGIA